ncbi:MAG TPA: ABC transporter substrate-binding protein [Nitrososphaerales archaeon]|nr:ABC transporter substrate-binding protein [Nitrososphaerales archaeon]
MSTTSTAPTRTSLQVDEPEQPDYLDPAVTYETSGWEVVEQIYQGLLTYNGTSDTTYEGVLASSWTVSPDGMNYTFILRPNVTFSNGDPFNAYVEWYSVYRTIVMDQSPSWILSQNLAAGNGVTFNVTASMLNSINYFSPSPANLTVMSNPEQSVVALNASAIQFNLGYGYNGDSPYSAFLATLITPMAMAVDPAVVNSNGEVAAGTPNDWMTTNALGTGFYELESWVLGQSVTLVKNPNYWANSLPKSQLNNAIAPAILNRIVFYYKDSATSVADLTAGTVQMISVPVTYYNVTTPIPGVTTSILPIVFGSSEDVHYLYLDTAAFPLFNNLDVREAIANAINYQDIIRTVFNGHAQQWIGPVPPGFQYYNESTEGLSPYPYNPVQAAVLLAQAGFVSHLPNGTTLNPGGKAFPTVPFLYDSDNPTDFYVATVIAANLLAIGIPISPSPLPFREYSTLIDSQSSDNTTFAMGFAYYSEDYTASVDYVSYFTSTNEIGSSAYVDPQVINWTTQAATALNSSTIITAFHNITQSMYYNYTDIWLYVPEFMAVTANGITGIIPNPAGSGMGYFLYYNTISYAS